MSIEIVIDEKNDCETSESAAVVKTGSWKSVVNEKTVELRVWFGGGLYVGGVWACFQGECRF